MLEKPELADEKLIACLQRAYGLRVIQLVFLPLGADFNTAVYRAIADDAIAYFVKLRRGVFDEGSVTLPKFLSAQGIAQIISPLETGAGQLWASLDPFTVILYPFIEGRDGYAVTLSDQHWHDFGTALRRIHTAALPDALLQTIPQERYSAREREQVKAALLELKDATFEDPGAKKVAEFLWAKRDQTLDLLDRAERGAQALRGRTPELVVCHSDIHAGNIFIDANQQLYIVDWDNPILAPKERDLMFIGGAQGFAGHTPQEEERLFYQGYGQTQIDPLTLAYYRYERIVQDIAAYWKELFLTPEGGADREQSLRYLASNFLPGGTIERAYAADPALRNG